MEISQLSMMGGFLLGLASSLHCAGMCGGLSASFLLMLDAPTPVARLRALTLMHAGRFLAYVTGGALFGGLGASLVGILPTAVAFKLLQWAGAVSLMWIGLSTAGLMPSIALADRILAPISGTIGRLAPRGGSTLLAPIGMGIAWGCMPCAMVYGALLTATLTGSAIGGGSVMLGFAFGTVPAVAATSLGLRSLASLDAAKGIRAAIGLAIAAVGMASVYVPPATLAALCW